MIRYESKTYIYAVTRTAFTWWPEIDRDNSDLGSFRWLGLSVEWFSKDWLAFGDELGCGMESMLEAIEEEVSKS